MSRLRLALAVTALALAASACTSSTGGTPSSVPVSTLPPTSSTPPPPPRTSSSVAASTPHSSPTKTHPPKPKPTPTKTSSAPPPPPTSSTPPPPPPTTSSTAPPGPPSCTADQLTASGVRGGAYQGREIAGVVFTNSSSSTCTAQGYPYAQLRYKGAPLGHPAKDDPGTVRPIVLPPGKSAQSQLTAVTTCQAPISDHVRVVAPNTGKPKDVALQLRGCSLSIDPLEAG